MAAASAPSILPSLNKRGQDGVKNMVEMFAGVFRQESQYKVAVLLEQDVLAPVPPIGVGVGQMLGAIQLNDHAGLRA